MSTELVTKDNERIKSLFCSLDRLLDRIVMTGYEPSLNGERFLTVAQVSDRLKISRRALQEYRTKGKIPYLQLGGKTLYRESDIQKLLEQNYREAWD